MLSGTVFNIQRFSIHDGPGIRTTVFLKGCNLRCFWCHNPEAWETEPQVQFFPEKCIACGACVEVCENDAQLLNGDQRLYLRDLCTSCMSCVQECFSGALEQSGKVYTVEDILAEIERDRTYYQFSDGGVTFSGGEPFLQQPFLKEVLQACKEAGFHTAVDTALNVPWALVEEVLPYTDLFLVDVKAFDDEIHRQATGVSNRRILDNLKLLSAVHPQIWIRIPVIPGVNDSASELESISMYLATLESIRWIELLPFHTLGSEKYPSLGMDYPAQGLVMPSKNDMEKTLEVFQQKQLSARIMV